MSNQLISHWLIIGYDQWVIEAQKLCGLSISHLWHRLLIYVIDYSSMTHRLLIDYYTVHKSHIYLFFYFIWTSSNDLAFELNASP